MVRSTTRIVRQPKIPAPRMQFLWGRLDAPLSGGNTLTGVQVSLWKDDWSGDTMVDIKGVLPPPVLKATDSIPVNSLVRITQRGDGRWYVDMAPEC